MVDDRVKPTPLARVIEVRSGEDVERYLPARPEGTHPAGPHNAPGGGVLVSFGPVDARTAHDLHRALRKEKLCGSTWVLDPMRSNEPCLFAWVDPGALLPLRRSGRRTRTDRSIQEIREVVQNYVAAEERVVALAGGRELRVGGRALVMGVLNVTPDSFSDGGNFFSTDRAIARARRMVKEGADLVDIGGESTRPGASWVSAEEEERRVLPVVKEIAEGLSVPVSIDTRRPRIAEKALRSGASLVNDVGGLRSSAMRKVVQRAGAGVAVMHMRGEPSTMQMLTRYADLRGEVFRFLKERTELARADKISADHLIVDPGIGFGKSVEGNVDLLSHLGEFRALGYPVLVGTSRKSFLGHLSGGAVVTDRLEASLGSAVVAALHGADIVRVHDVRETVRALTLVNAIADGRSPRH